MKFFLLAINDKSQNVSFDQLIAVSLLITASDSIWESSLIQLTNSSQQRNVINCNNVHAGNIPNTSSETESRTPEYLTETDLIYS